jgi:hypothetical protein
MNNHRTDGLERERMHACGLETILNTQIRYRSRHYVD